jgi:hypothetical protein
MNRRAVFSCQSCWIDWKWPWLIARVLVCTQRMREFATLRLKLKCGVSNFSHNLEAAQKYRYCVQSYCKELDNFSDLLCISYLGHERNNNISMNGISGRFYFVCQLWKLIHELTMWDSNLNYSKWQAKSKRHALSDLLKENQPHLCNMWFPNKMARYHMSHCCDKVSEW